MEEGFFDLAGLIKSPVVMETFVDILLCAVPIWLAVMIGLVIGWSWRPRWSGIVFLGFRSKLRFLWTAPPGFGARRLWFAFTALSAFSLIRTLCSRLRGKSKDQPASEQRLASSASSYGESTGDVDRHSFSDSNVAPGHEEPNIVTENDLEHLFQLLEENDSEIPWQSMMEKSTPSMTYQGWCHDPENGPTIYRSRTVFEDASAELVRDFFWDDEFRPTWDRMLTKCKILDECPNTGIMTVHWIKKFPFFCSDREYIISRRIWEAGTTYYCVTKGVPYPCLPKRDKPRRVEQYFSSWAIKPVESRRGDGQLNACEVTLIHYEDMGIPKDLAKLGVRQGMWGTVKKLHSGMRAYQNLRKPEPSLSLSRCAQFARITTKTSDDSVKGGASEEEEDARRRRALGFKNRERHGIDWKWVVIGGTVAVACGLHTGVIGKALLFGAGRRLARR